MQGNFNGQMRPGQQRAPRSFRTSKAAMQSLAIAYLVLAGRPLSAAPSVDPAMTQGLVVWPWTGQILWRDDPALEHRSWNMGSAIALQSMRSGYESLRLDAGAEESMSARMPARGLGWFALSGPVSRRLSAAMGWYRTDSGEVRFQMPGLAQRFLFRRALRFKDVVVWNLAMAVVQGLSLGVGLGFERLAVEQDTILWPGESRSRPAADQTFDLPIRVTLSGYRARLGLGLAWSGPGWLTILAAAEVLTPIHMTGRFVLSPGNPSVNLLMQETGGTASLERGPAVRARLLLTAELPYSVLALGANMEGPGYRRNMIAVHDLAVTGPAGPGQISELPPAWQPRGWTWSLHTTLGARLERRGLRLLGGFSATSPNRSLCGRLSQTPDFGTGFSLIVRMGTAMLAASYGHQWTETRCNHAFPAAFNPSAGPTRAVTERKRSLGTDLAVFTIVLSMP